LTLDVTRHIVEGSNELLLLFESAFLKGRELEAAADAKLPTVLGDREQATRLCGLLMRVQPPEFSYASKRASMAGIVRVPVTLQIIAYRFAPGGPALVSAGPWKPIHLEVFKAKIVDPWAQVQLDDQLSSATINARYSLHESPGANAIIRFSVSDASGAARCSAEVPAGNELQAKFDLSAEDLWWPAGSGAQPIFSARWDLLVDVSQVSLHTPRTDFAGHCRPF
jgi:hypothetical protein